MTEVPKILLAHHLKTLKLPTFLREYEKLARGGGGRQINHLRASARRRARGTAEGLDHVQFLARLVELALIDRERRRIERRIKAAKFPATKSLDSFDFKAIPKLNKMQVLELARSVWTLRRENVIMPEACLRHDALGPSGTGKTHIMPEACLRHDALGLGLAACQKGQVGQLHHRCRVRHGPRTSGGSMAHSMS